MTAASMELQVDYDDRPVDDRPGDHQLVDDQRATLRISGDFDRFQVERFDQAVRDLPASIGSVAVDLTGATIIDSSALGCLVRLRNRMDVLGGRLTVSVATTFQVTVMTASGLYDHLGVSVVESDETR